MACNLSTKQKCQSIIWRIAEREVKCFDENGNTNSDEDIEIRLDEEKGRRKKVKGPCNKGSTND